MNKLRVAVIGSGIVGEVLSNGFLKYGYEVFRASREPAKLADWKALAGEHASIGTFQQAADFSDLIVFAVKGLAAEQAVKIIGPEKLKGKTIIDTTNPIADAPPEKGVLKYFTSLDNSLMERLQKLAPEAHFVKAFSSVGNAFMVNPQFVQGQPTMFICGNNQESKNRVSQILTQFGWETEDLGTVEAARAIEPLCILWCVPGFIRNEWNHAFKLLRG